MTAAWGQGSREISHRRAGVVSPDRPPPPRSPGAAPPRSARRSALPRTRPTARQLLNALEVTAVGGVTVHRTGQVQLPAVQTRVRQLSKSGDQRVLPLAVAAREEPPHRQDDALLAGQVWLRGRAVDGRVDDGR